MVKIIRIILVLLLVVLPQVSPAAQEKIVEQVEVNWWQIPIFAVDKRGYPVRDLKPGDIEVVINGFILSDFTMQQRSFTMAEHQFAPIAQETPKEKPPVSRGKVVVLLFDLSMSGTVFTQRAKEIAKKIVMEAEENSRLILLTIEPDAGLNYIGEGTATLPNKSALLGMIKKKVIERGTNARRISNPNMLQEIFNLKRYVSTWGTGAMEFFKRKSGIFFQSFKTLYFYLNSIQENKFIYLFSEGIPKSAVEGIRGGASLFNSSLEETAKSLSSCGAVLFLINTMGVDQYTSTMVADDSEGVDILDSDNPLSGEASLKYLAKVSGGTYMEGPPDQIIERIENMNLSYYEISFSDIPELKGTTRQITVTSKQPGIVIHSLSALEKRKNYTEMADIEKDMLVLNLINVNPLAEGKIEAFNARVENVKEGKKELVYHLLLPPSFLNKTIDVYKFWVINDQEVTHVEKESVIPRENKLPLLFKMDLPKSGEETAKGELKTYFALVDGAANSARVHGIDLYEEDPELPELAREEEQTSTQIKPSGKTITTEEMNRILQGTADYCDRLRNSAFHFYCEERIVETHLPLTEADLNNPEINEEMMKKGVVRSLDEIRTKAYTIVKNYVFGYRLLKQGRKINEERNWISSSDNVKVDRNKVIRTNAFFSEKAIFAPITLLDRTRQDFYDFQFIDFDEYKGRTAVVLEATPKDPKKTLGVYGKIWIDNGDFSVMKIDANPKSIGGYDKLKELAAKMRTKLILTLETEFDALRDGIRFPTKVSMLEKYKGGRIITEYRGNRGWERTRTEFSYHDYQFFDVKTDVTSEEIKKQ